MRYLYSIIQHFSRHSRYKLTHLYFLYHLSAQSSPCYLSYMKQFAQIFSIGFDFAPSRDGSFLYVYSIGYCFPGVISLFLRYAFSLADSSIRALTAAKTINGIYRNLFQYSAITADFFWYFAILRKLPTHHLTVGAHDFIFLSNRSLILRPHSWVKVRWRWPLPRIGLFFFRCGFTATVNNIN